MSLPSEPFERLEGQTQSVAIHNRICAIKRIEYLSGFDVSLETNEFKELIDIEMNSRWYKDYPKDHVIDEQWCQRAALVVKDLKEHKEEDLKVMEEGADERVKELYQEHQLRPSLPSELNCVAEPQSISLFKRFFKKLWN